MTAHTRWRQSRTVQTPSWRVKVRPAEQRRPTDELTSLAGVTSRRVWQWHVSTIGSRSEQRAGAAGPDQSSPSISWGNRSVSFADVRWSNRLAARSVPGLWRDGLSQLRNHYHYRAKVGRGYAIVRHGAAYRVELFSPVPAGLTFTTHRQSDLSADRSHLSVIPINLLHSCVCATFVVPGVSNPPPDFPGSWDILEKGGKQRSKFFLQIVLNLLGSFFASAKNYVL